MHANGLRNLRNGNPGFVTHGNDTLPHEIKVESSNISHELQISTVGMIEGGQAPVGNVMSARCTPSPRS
jgi:hypothetical protein